MNDTIGCIIMAAGDSSRFGKKDKLLEPFAGETMIEHVLDAIPYDMLSRCILVTGSDAILEIATRYNIQVLINMRPELGIGRTIKIGTMALGQSFDGYMYVVGDQPLLTQTSVVNLIRFWQSQPEKIAALGFGKRAGNPVIFPKRYYNELMELQDSEYGRVIYHRHRDQFRTTAVSDEYELMDIDTIEDLEVLKAHYKK